MPATGPGEAPPVVVRRKRRVQRKAKQAAPAYKPPAGDTKSDLQAGDDFKATAPYRGSVRVAYKSKSLGERKQRVRRARRNVKAGTASREDKAVLHYHDTAVAGSKRVARANRAFEALDPVSTAVRHGEKPPRGLSGTGPKVKRREQSVLGKVGHALGSAITAVGAASSKGYESVNAPKILVNAPKDLADLVVTTPSSIAKLGSDVVHHPSKVPGELVAPYKELVEHPGKFITEHPVSTALMVAPAARVPGRAVGRVARVAGKQTLERPAATFAGTNLREVRTGSKDYVVRRRQARKDAAGEAPQMTEKQVNQRVDAFFDASRRTTDRMVGGAERGARKRGLTGDEFDAQIKGARKGARKVVRRKFAQEFGGEIHPTKEAAKAAGEQLPFEPRVMKVGKDQFTNVPEFAADRLRHHEKVGSSKAMGARVMRTSRRAFSRTVLPFSTRWITGQAVESAFRAMVTGSGPVSYVRGRRVLGALDDAEATARMVPGGLSRVARETTQKTLADEYAGTSLARIAKAATALGKAPVARNVRATHAAVSDFIFDVLNGRIESTTQTAMLGRALKESPLMERRVVGLSDRAIKDAAEGLKSTEAQVALGREIHNMFGKYSGFSPGAREAIMHWTPFAPWLGNMTKFVFRTLPKDHPVAAALLADIDAATEEWRKAAGLSFHGGDRKPGFLLGSTPVGEDGQVVRVGRYLPFVPGDVGVESLADLLLPQFAGAYRAASGQNAITGQPLHGKYGPDATEAEKALGVAVQLIEGMIPSVGQAERIRSEGANRALNPLAPTRAPKVKVKRKKGVRVLPLNIDPVSVDTGKIDLP